VLLVALSLADFWHPCTFCQGLKRELSEDVFFFSPDGLIILP
jgi:hypothetical protein